MRRNGAKRRTLSKGAGKASKKEREKFEDVNGKMLAKEVKQSILGLPINYGSCYIRHGIPTLDETELVRP